MPMVLPMALRDSECVQQANIHLRVLLARIAQQVPDLILQQVLLVKEQIQQALYAAIARQGNILPIPL